MKNIKKFIVLIGVLVLLLQFDMQAQEYLPFPQDSAVWYSVYSWPDPYPPYIYYKTYKYEAKGDTIINEKQYTKFYSGISGFMHYDGAYRIETDSNRVYYYNRFDNFERLVYDFNLLPGDTIISGNVNFICLDTGSIILNNGINHKFQTMLVPIADNCIQIWIHGVGSLRVPLLEPNWCCGYTFESAYDLTCFFYKEEQIYEWEENPYFDGCIGTNVGIKKYQNDKSFVVAPNPVTGTSHLICNTNNTLFDYRIIDVNGNVLQSALGVQPDNILIQNRRFSTGIYLLRLYSHNIKQYFSIKFIIN